MQLEYVPLLRVQRELYEMPRGWERFQAYLKTMVDTATGDIKLPLAGMNPMGKAHLSTLLDKYLAFDADGLAAQAVAESVTDAAGAFKVTLVLCDDAQGGWTNRYAAEFSQRFTTQAMHKRGWLTGALWTSETPTPVAVREFVLTTAWRGNYLQKHGFAVTLQEMLAQEGYAMTRTGTMQWLDVDDLAYTAEVLAPYLTAKDLPTQMVCIFGDEAARSLGYPPLGLSQRAGLAWALDSALQANN